MLRFFMKVCILVVVISVVPSVTFSEQASHNEVATFASMFKIKDMNVARNIVNELKRKYGIKDVTQERVIDVLAKRYHTSVEQLQKIEPVMINIGTLAPANTPWIKDAIDTSIPILAWETRGVVNARIYAGGVMGEDADILRKMRLGELQGCGCTAQGFMNAAPELSVLTLPLLFDNYKQVDCVLDGLRKDIDDIFAKHGYVLVGLIHTGFFYIFTRNDVTSLAQLKQQKVITWFGRIERTYLNQLGIKPIPIAVPDILSSLQTGIVNVDMGPPVWMLGVQAFLYLRYFVTPPVFYSPAAIFLDRKQIDQAGKRFPPGLTDDTITLYSDFMRMYEPEWRSDIVSFEKQSMVAFKKEGLKDIRFDDADMKTMRTAAKATWNQLDGDVYPKSLLEKVMQQRKKCSMER